MLTPNVRTLGLATHRLMARLAATSGLGTRARYGLPVGGAIATVGLVDSTTDVLPGGGAFLLLLAPVMAASTALGFRAGVLALGLGAVGACLLVLLRDHPWYTEPAHVARLALFLVEGLCIATLGFVVRSAALPAARSHRDAGAMAVDPLTPRELSSAALPPASSQRDAGAMAVDPLTPRELEVLTIAATGLQIHEIARQLFVSRETVKSHLAHSYAKLGARNRADAVARALNVGLIEVVPADGPEAAERVGASH